MNISKYGLLALLLVIIFAVSLFGGHFGFAVNGVPYGGEMSGENPGIFGVLEWVWDSMGFFFYMVTFQVDGMPEFISAIFVIMSLLTLAIVIWTVRGN